MNRPGVLLLATIFGILFQAGAQEQTADFVIEFLEKIDEAEPQLKKAFRELKAENAPQSEFSFPLANPTLPAELEYDLAKGIDGPVSPQWPSDEGLSSGATLMAALPPVAVMEPPPLAPVAVDSRHFDEVGDLAGSEHFDVQVEYAPKRNRPGYVFKITLLPKTDIQFKKIRQNFYFLLDRSNSIPRARYFLNKKAVAETFDLLKPKDRFNILLFDDHVVRFRPLPVEASAEAIAEAKLFLENHGHGGYFAATELLASLGKIIPEDVAEGEINTAILLSDGDTYLSQEKQRLTIGRWTAKNAGKVSLHTIASGTGNNLPLLELLSAFNKGSLIYTQDHQDLVERMRYLMRTLQNPIGKNMVATSICDDKAMTVLLQPKPSRIPDLYQNRPFVIYGSTNKLSDFALFLQGKYYDYSFNIKKIISFEQAKIGSFAIERGWTQLVVQEFYEKYFEDGNFSHLEAAKQLLLPLNLPMPLIE